MYRTALLVLAALVSVPAFAASPSAIPADVMKGTVKIQLQGCRDLAAAMDAHDPSWRSEDANAAALDQLQQARADFRDGDQRGAGRLVRQAWTGLGPEFKAFLADANDTDLRAINTAVMTATTNRIALMRRGDVGLNSDAEVHVRSAETAHADAAGLRTAGDLRGAVTQERTALRQLDLAIGSMLKGDATSADAAE